MSIRAAHADPLLSKIEPDAIIKTSGTTFQLYGTDFSPGDQIVIWGSHPQVINQIPAFDPNKLETGAQITTIYISGTRAYLIEDFKTLHILDITDPHQPQLVKSIRDSRFGNIKRLCTAGRYLYMTDTSYGLWVVDLSSPGGPSLIGNGTPPFSYYAPQTYGLSVKGSLIFTTNWLAGLQILEQLVTGQLIARGSIQLSGTPYDVCVTENLAIVSTDSALHVFDVSTPSNPKSVSSLSQPFGASTYLRKVIAVDTLLYVSDLDFGFHIVDISSPKAPAILTSFPISGQTKDIQICGPYILVANGFQGIQIVDLHQIAAPFIVGSVYSEGDATALSFINGSMLVANGYAGLGIVDAPFFTQPLLRGSLQTGSDIWAITAQGDYVYISNNSKSGLKIVDINPPWAPQVVSTIQTTKMGTYCAVNGNMLYLADNTIFKIYSITNPLAPVLNGTLPLSDTIMSFFLYGGYAFLANFAFGAKAVNIANPANPTVASFVYGDGLSYDIILDQGIAFLANGPEGLWAIDFSNPSQPIDKGGINMFSHANSLKKYKNRIYMTNGLEGIEIIDATSMENLNPIGSHDQGDYLKKIDIAYPFLYTSGENQGVWINHLSSGGDLTTITTINLPKGSNAVKADGDLLYCADGEGTFYIFSAPVLGQISSINYSKLTFRINSDLPTGQYDIYLVTRFGEVSSLRRGFEVYQQGDTLTKGFDILSFPGVVPPTTVKAFELLSDLYSRSGLAIDKLCTKRGNQHWKTAVMSQNGTPSGEDFDIVTLRAYPFYASNPPQGEIVLPGTPLELSTEGLVTMIEGEIVTGINFIAIPVFGESPLPASRLMEPATAPVVHSIHGWDNRKGRWQAGYPFFGKASGETQEIDGGRGYLVYGN